MNTRELTDKLNAKILNIQAKGKKADIDLYLSLLDTTMNFVKDQTPSGKTLFIGFTGSTVSVSLEPSPYGLTKWSEVHKTEMNIIVGPWLFNPDNKKFEECEGSHFFLECWHGYMIGQVSPFMIIDDQLRYPFRKVA